MSNVRNWYIYIVSAISLQAVTWSTIDLLRNLLVFGADPLAIAFQIAVIIIGLPVFLVHWLWAQRLARNAVEERGGILRRLYFYGTLAGLLGSFIPNVFDLVRTFVMDPNTGRSYDRYNDLSTGEAAIFHVIALLVLAAIWYYHQRVLAEDVGVVPLSGGSATIRRLYVLVFSTVGLTLTVHAVIQIIRWIMQQLEGGISVQAWLRVALAEEIIRLALGVTLWLIFWLWAQRLFNGPNEEEHASALRKFYLYAAVCVGALNAVVNVTGILASLIRRLWAALYVSEGHLSQPLPIIIAMALLWAYHATVLRQDALQAGETQRQAGVRRLYYYLVAAIGLAALLVGLVGDISVLLRSLVASFGSGLWEEFSYFTAAIIAGLPVWIIPWRKVNNAAVSAEPTSLEERCSVVRKVYLYFFLFIATMTIFSSAVFIIFKILSMILGGGMLTLTELGSAIADSLIATGVLLYHGSLLRGDSRRARSEQARQLEAAGVVILDVGEGQLGQAVVAELKHENPAITLEPIMLPLQAVEAEGTDEWLETILRQIATAQLIVAPWMVAVAGGAVPTRIAEAVASSPAHKLLVPSPAQGWDWVGIEPWKFDEIANHTVKSMKQLMAGEAVKLHRPLGVGAIIGIVIGVLIILGLIGFSFYNFLWY